MRSSAFDTGAAGGGGAPTTTVGRTQRRAGRRMRGAPVSEGS